ncbi:MAG: sel1 repeat family protein [Herminiimonas sp.]|nr:sel1 repeat family protein [Herminiimonas sp.]
MKISPVLCIFVLCLPSMQVIAESRITADTPALNFTGKSASSVALRSLQRRAAEGDTTAQYEMGTRYLKGNGVKQDNAAAFAWFRRAADNDNADAQFMLAGMYDEGLAVAQDFQTAAEWNLKAAQQGHAGALYNLGMLHTMGDGVARDLIQAHMWFNLAAAKGNAAGVEGRKRCEVKMSQWQLGEAQALAREWQAKFK